MSSLSYNPNISIPSYQPMDQFSNKMTGNLSSNSMYQPMSNQNMSNQNMSNQPMSTHYNNMYMRDPNQHNMNYMPQPMSVNNNDINFPPPYQQSPQKKSLIDSFKNSNSKKIDWYLIGKKIVVYTILFLIMSHLIMNNMVCRFIPFTSNNEIVCMVVKGLIMSIMIILLQGLL